ncbi:MAG: hypothetical protein ACR2KV_08780, partial [Solirubrobacteraceae bacterium]
RCVATSLPGVLSPSSLSPVAPPLLESFDLSRGRAVALVAVAREVASGRVDLHDTDHERGWRRLRATPGIGAWTVEILGLHGQGRLDQVPAGDLGLRKFVGRALDGDPRACAETEVVRDFFAPFAPYGGLAATYALHRAAALGPTPPARAGTRRSAPGRRRPGV